MLAEVGGPALSDAAPDPAPMPAASTARELRMRAWHGVYEFFYAGLQAGTTILFRALFLVRTPAARPAIPDGGVILCPNHQSYLDPAFVQLVVRRRVLFVMTNAFYSSKWARWFFRLVGALPVGSGRQALTTMKRAAALLRLGHALVVFPEGRLSTDGALHPGQRGIAMLARRGRAPIVPVAIEGSRRAWRKGGRWMRRADVRLAFGEALVGSPVGGRLEDQRLADEVMSRIAALKRAIPPVRP